jgi:hypothetical protein
MDANIFVIGVPSLKGIMSRVAKAIDDEFFVKKLHVSEDDFDDDEDFIDDEDEDEDDYEPTPPPSYKPKPVYKPRPEDLRFGYGLQVDEPRAKDYTSRWKFLRDHEAYDNFVDAGLRCEELGLDKKNDIPITKCKAIRKRVGDLPPTGIDLLGETNWWDEDFTW